MAFADLHSKKCCFAAQSQGTDPQAVGVGQDTSFQCGQSGIGIDVFEAPQEPMLRFGIRLLRGRRRCKPPRMPGGQPFPSARRTASIITRRTPFEIAPRIKRGVRHTVLTADIFAPLP